MDEWDGILLGICMAALAAAVMLLARAVRDMQTDLELVRMTVPAATGKE